MEDGRGNNRTRSCCSTAASMFTRKTDTFNWGELRRLGTVTCEIMMARGRAVDSDMNIDIDPSRNTEYKQRVWIKIKTTVFCPSLALGTQAVLTISHACSPLRSGEVRGVIGVGH